MGNDVRKVIYISLVAFLGVVTLWVGFLFTVGCNGSLDCIKADPTPIRTSIPTLIPATLPPPQIGKVAVFKPKCRVAATELLKEWINSGYPETDPFQFTDADGKACTATYTDDVTILFHEANIWYSGALPCASCHNADVAKAQANMDLSTYEGILMGSRRIPADAKGNDILGGGVWDQSKLHEVLIARKGQPLAMPLGRPVDMDAEKVFVFAGSPATAPGSDATPSPTAQP
jgi:hypothetical protein